MKSILVVDDEYDIAVALELLLAGEGYRVTIAPNGKEALDRIAEARPDLVFMDVMMPVLTGLEAVKIIKADPHLSTIPVVLMSAVVPRASQDDYKWDLFLRKPLDVDRILDAVAQFFKVE